MRGRSVVGVLCLVAGSLLIESCSDNQASTGASSQKGPTNMADAGTADTPQQGKYYQPWTRLVGTMAPDANGTPQPCPASLGQLKGWTPVLLPNSHFCIYEWNDEDLAPEVTSAPQGFASLSLDPPIVQLLDSPDAGSTASRSRPVILTGEGLKLFLNHARQRTLSAAGGISTSGSSLDSLGKVRIGLPDTSPSDGETPDSAGKLAGGDSPHGFNLGWIAYTLLSCSGPNGCMAQTRTELGLETPQAAGTRSQLAWAIRKLVDRWKAKESTTKLIVNIAAGWEPEYECGGGKILPEGQPDATAKLYQLQSSFGQQCTGQVSDGAKAVYEALGYAACNGALVVAAAGNDARYEQRRTGPMLPAAWHGKMVEPGTCDQLHGVSGLQRSVPLVYAVGGVDHDHRAIPVARVHATPPLVTHAYAAAGFPDPENEDYRAQCAHVVPRARNCAIDSPGCALRAGECYQSMALTGTSVAAITASSAAAAVWAVNPGLSAEAVMQTVYRSGIPVADHADFCFGDAGTPCPDNAQTGPLATASEVREASVCGAIIEACRDPRARDARRAPPDVGARPPAHALCAQACSIASRQSRPWSRPVRANRLKLLDYPLGTIRFDAQLPFNTVAASSPQIVRGQPTPVCGACTVTVLPSTTECPDQFQVILDGYVAHDFFTTNGVESVTAPSLEVYEGSSVYTIATTDSYWSSPPSTPPHWTEGGQIVTAWKCMTIGSPSSLRAVFRTTLNYGTTSVPSSEAVTVTGP